MGLEDQVFQNYEKWMQTCKGWECNLDKCLYPLNTLLMTELPSSFDKIGVYANTWNVLLMKLPTLSQVALLSYKIS